MKLFASFVRPLRHLLPLAWRIELKTWIRDRSHTHSTLSRFLRWFISPVARLTYTPERELPAPPREEWRANTEWSGPLLSVIIPYHNQGEYLIEALESVWRQTFTDFELIIVNDGSTDQASLDLLTEINEPRTRVVHRENGGLPAARNTGLREAKGKYLCCLDSDDALHATHFEKLLIALESRQCDLAHCDLERFDKGEGFWRGEGFHVASLLGGNAVGNTATGILRLEACKRIGDYDESLRGYQDWDFWLRLAAAGHRATHVPEPLFLYRRHGTSMISRSVRRHRELESQILTKHPDLTGNPENLKSFEGDWKRMIAEEPFLNLISSRHRSLRTLIVVDSLPHPAISALMQNPPDEEIVIVALRDENPTDEPTRIAPPQVHLFIAENILPPEHKKALPGHLIATHAVEHVILLGDDVAIAPEALAKAMLTPLPPSATEAVLREALGTPSPH